MEAQTLDTPKPKRYIAKSNDYINSPKHLTAAQRNVLNVILTKIKLNSDIDFIDFQLREISELMGITVTNFEQFRQVFRTMKSIEVVDIASEGLSIDSLIGETVFLHNNMGVRFYLTNMAKNHFVKLHGKQYTKQLLSSSIFQSVYVHEIWDLICQIKNKRVKTIVLSIEDLRSRMMIHPGKYSEFNDFKKRVLEPSKQTINEKTGIKIDYQPIKVGRNIVSVKFMIVSIVEAEQNEVVEIPPVNSSEDQERMRIILKKEFKFTDEEIEMLCTKYPSNDFFKLLFSIRNRKGSPTEVKNPERVIIFDYQRVTK
jgi:hypothetical protein